MRWKFQTSEFKFAIDKVEIWYRASNRWMINKATDNFRGKRELKTANDILKVRSIWSRGSSYGQNREEK